MCFAPDYSGHFFCLKRRWAGVLENTHCGQSPCVVVGIRRLDTSSGQGALGCIEVQLNAC